MIMGILEVGLNVFVIMRRLWYEFMGLKGRSYGLKKVYCYVKL